MSVTKPNLTLDAARQRARGMQDLLASGGTTIKLSACFELLALAHGAPNWNVLSARLPREQADAKPPRALLKALAGHAERGKLLGAYEACRPVVYAGSDVPWGLPVEADEVGLVIPLAVHPHALGRMLTFVGKAGAVRLYHGFAGATEAREGGIREVEDLNPRSWYLRHALRQCAATMPDDHARANLESPAGTAMAEALIERAAMAIQGFLAEHAPARYQLMRRFNRWNGSWITHAIASGDPDAFLTRLGRYPWLIDELGLCEARPDDPGLRSLLDDPEAEYARSRQRLGLPPVRADGEPGGGLSWPGMHADAFADDVSLYDTLALAHPGFCAAAGDILPGRMSWLRVFVDGGHEFSARDLPGLKDALTAIDDTVALAYAENFRGKPPVEGACAWDLDDEARVPLARARVALGDGGGADVRNEPECERSANDRAVLLGMAAEIGIPEVLTFVAESIQAWDSFYRRHDLLSFRVGRPQEEHRHHELATAVLGRVLTEAAIAGAA